MAPRHSAALHTVNRVLFVAAAPLALLAPAVVQRGLRGSGVAQDGRPVCWMS